MPSAWEDLPEVYVEMAAESLMRRYDANRRSADSTRDEGKTGPDLWVDTMLGTMMSSLPSLDASPVEWVRADGIPRDRRVLIFPLRYSPFII